MSFLGSSLQKQLHIHMYIFIAAQFVFKIPDLLGYE